MGALPRKANRGQPRDADISTKGTQSRDSRSKNCQSPGMRVSVMSERMELQMRKQIVPRDEDKRLPATEHWLDLESLAELEITSEDPEHPIDAAIAAGSGGSGWCASNTGE